jgi:hypothetical protein
MFTRNARVTLYIFHSSDYWNRRGTILYEIESKDDYYLPK